MADTRGRKGDAKSARGSNRTSRSGKKDEGALLGEIYGIALSALALVFLISVLTESVGVVPRALSELLRYAFGVGAYFVPAFILVWGVTFFFPDLDIHELVTGAGLGTAFLSIVAMISLSGPGGSYVAADTVAGRGGYVGGAIAWLFHSLLGTAISYVVLIAVLLISIVASTGISLVGVVRGAAARLAPAPEDTRARRQRPAKTTPMPGLPDEGSPVDAEAPAVAKSGRRRARPSDPEAGRQTLPSQPTAAPSAMEGFELPDPSLLTRSPKATSSERASERELKATATVIEQTLGTFDITARVVSWIPGPTVTMFEIKIAQGVKVHRITALSDDLALALAAPTIRILAPIPGKSLVGIEVPNARRSAITLGDVLAQADLADRGPLAIGVGMDVAGEPVVADLATMPHLLIAGSTGTGKSVCINAIIASVLMRSTPAEVRFILIDPKRIELNLYNGLAHLYVPVVTEAKEAASALHWAVREMESRLRRLQKAGVRNIAGFNALVQSGDAPEGADEMPYIVIVIDELADLMMVAAKEVEDSICRLAQLARAAGIHLIVATQRPSTDIITGLIKTNITHRIAFAVSSGIDSRVILDQSGAENLVGLGDMLFSTPAWPKPRRLQGPIVTEQEIEKLAAHLRAQAEPEYHEEILHLKVPAHGGAGLAGLDEADDPLLWEAADIVVTSGIGSTSLLQRRLKVGYARAGRIMDMLEGKGVVGPPDGSKPREVLVDVEELESLKAFERSEDDEAE